MNSRARVMIASALVVLLVTLANSATTICNVPLYGLKTCLPAALPNPQPPTVECRGCLANADLCCLYKYRDSPVLRAIGIDPDMAIQIPTKCELPNIPTHC